MQHSPLGPLADGLTLAQIGLGDRLRELDFEFPLAGGERPSAEVPLAAMAEVLRRHLPTATRCAATPTGWSRPSLGGQALRGYLSGSIDVVLRVGGPGSPAGVLVSASSSSTTRPTGWGHPGEPVTALDYTPGLMTEAMLHSHYPLQAMLYSVVLHRYLRWRLAGIRPRAAPRRHPLPLRPRHVSAPRRRAWTAIPAESSPGIHRPPWSSSSPTCSTAGSSRRT